MRKSYKQNSHEMNMGQKRGQLGLFVIIALVIVAIVLVFLLSPYSQLPGREDTATPQQYLASCLETEIRPLLEEFALQGGYSEPVGFIVYNESKLPYLCYTSEYYKPCVIQQSDIIRNFEKSLNEALGEEARRCTEQFEEEFESRGYSISRTTSSVNVSFVPGKLQVQIIAPMTVSRDVSRTYQSFDLSYESEMYDLTAIATSILDFESTYGDSETTDYLRFYPDLKIQKTKLSEGSKIYRISNVVSKEEFAFATRSLAWGAGYPTQ